MLAQPSSSARQKSLSHLLRLRSSDTLMKWGWNGRQAAEIHVGHVQYVDEIDYRARSVRRTSSPYHWSLVDENG